MGLRIESFQIDVRKYREQKDMKRKQTKVTAATNTAMIMLVPNFTNEVLRSQKLMSPVSSWHVEKGASNFASIL